MRGPPPAPAACPAPRRDATVPVAAPLLPGASVPWSSASPPSASACSRAPTPGVRAGSWSRRWTGRSRVGLQRTFLLWLTTDDVPQTRRLGPRPGGRSAADPPARTRAQPSSRRRRGPGGRLHDLAAVVAADGGHRRRGRPGAARGRRRRARRAPGHGPPTSRAGSARTTSWRCRGPTPTSPRPRTPSTRTWSSWPSTAPRRPGSPGSPRPPVCCGHPAPRPRPGDRRRHRPGGCRRDRRPAVHRDGCQGDARCGRAGPDGRGSDHRLPTRRHPHRAAHGAGGRRAGRHDDHHRPARPRRAGRRHPRGRRPAAPPARARTRVGARHANVSALLAALGSTPWVRLAPVSSLLDAAQPEARTTLPASAADPDELAAERRAGARRRPGTRRRVRPGHQRARHLARRRRHRGPRAAVRRLARRSRRPGRPRDVRRRRRRRADHRPEHRPGQRLPGDRGEQRALRRRAERPHRPRHGPARRDPAQGVPGGRRDPRGAGRRAERDERAGPPERPRQLLGGRRRALTAPDGIAVSPTVRFTAQVAPTIESVGTIVVGVLLAHRPGPRHRPDRAARAERTPRGPHRGGGRRAHVAARARRRRPEETAPAEEPR